ncbi:MAG: hypothetical protein PHT00_00540 [Candidatus Methanomethylophilus sp.]|nr:hypothetical protein [Methanomethylophilus sp.]MDD3232646.1 hypothetical protein [Methanomethylophilus sp.]MDD4222064.1 hypothetical protein [Methanomethylophilus sp.]MDD4668528.1 hypothetical protein [Methanomethylophilus sp.]
MEGSEADLHRKAQAQQLGDMVRESRRTWIMFLLMIYAIPALIWAVYVLTDTSAVANTIWTNADLQSWFASHTEVTYDTIATYITASGVMIAVSGGCALISFICCYLRRYWIVAVAACFLAAFFCISSIFGVIVGIFVGWMIITAKDTFTAPLKSV